jgi:hypothetical protein
MSAKKLTKKEHEKLTTALSDLRSAEGQFTNASKNLKRVEEAVDTAWTAIQGFEGDLNALQSSMMEKYGNVNINIQTGEFVEPSEEE